MIRIGLIVSGILIGIEAAVSIYGWMTIPADMMIARHWDINGEPDGYSSRNLVLIGLPLLALVIAALFTAIPVIDPRKDNVFKSQGLYLTSWVGGLSIITLAHITIVVSAAGGGDLDYTLMLFGASVFVLVLGNFMAKSRSSWFLGVRTPWSLSSEHAWIASNRAAGWMFVLTGLSTIATRWLSGAQDMLFVLVAGSLAAALTGVTVSYFAWRGDTKRI